MVGWSGEAWIRYVVYCLLGEYGQKLVVYLQL